jgi:tetratricopeptide (TPR) repeat protein
MPRLLCLVSLLVLSYACVRAETIYLKSGKVVETDILEENADYIKIDFNSNPLYYQKKYISRIERTPSSGIPEHSAEDCFKKGLEEAIGGDFGKAKEEFKRGLVKDSGSYNIAAVLSLIDDFEAGKVSREYTLDLFNGLLKMLHSDYRQATPYFKHVLQTEPGNVDVLYNLGVCYYSLDNFEQAIITLKSIINIRPDDPEVYGLLGNAYYLVGDTQKAKESFFLARDLFLKAQDVSSASEIGAIINKLFPGQKAHQN